MTNPSTTPLMKQYQEIKAQYPNEILLFRLGDFYELFFDDAKVAAPILEVALTQRQGYPMCGVPYHAAQRYMAKLLAKGLRVAIAEQIEDPATAKGIVERKVTRVVSAGTIVEENLLKERANNFLLSINIQDGQAAIAALDISTGQFLVKEVSVAENFSALQNELCCLSPAEIVIDQNLTKEYPILSKIFGDIALAQISQDQVLDQSQNFEKYWQELQWKTRKLSIFAGNILLHYVSKMNAAFLPNISLPQWILSGENMLLDEQTIENLEILRNSQDGSSRQTLLWFLDQTLTPMGARRLKQWITRPLLQQPAIEDRLNVIDYFLKQVPQAQSVQELLKGIFDLERAIMRVGANNANPRDIIGIKQALEKMQQLKNILSQVPVTSDFASNTYKLPTLLTEILSHCLDSQEIVDLIKNAIAEEPPIALDQGGIIRSGYNADLDEKRQAAQEGKQWLQSLEAKEKAATNIPLRVGYTSVFGYYFEVTKTHLSKVPQNWHRKQTLVNAERYISQELKELESKILGAEEQALRMERGLFQQVVRALQEQIEPIQNAAAAIAQLDCLLSLWKVAELQSLTRPQFDSSDILEISGGWHPVVKTSLPQGQFVANDTFFNLQQNESTALKIMILTGPNMSGKSTYLRQNALIVLMAQLGSFVPAQSVRMGIVDRIFTRIGSGDRLSKGESTFMVEMQETAQILKNASDKSLIILDEVGRGTSTYDGISIAWAIVEHLAQDVHAKTLFATHYFELTHLEQKLPGVKNFNVQAKEWKDTVLFLHKIVPGPADRSYGVHVAQLAGLPEKVVTRSKKILQKLEQEHQTLLQSQTGRQLVFKLEVE